MEKIKIEYDESKLDIVVNILDHALKALPKTQEDTKNHAIATQLLKKLRKKQVDRTFKAGDFKVTYEVYEAIVFEQILRNNFELCNNEYQRNTVRMVADKINQLTV